MRPERIANGCLLMLGIAGAVVILYLIGAILGFWSLP